MKITNEIKAKVFAQYWGKSFQNGMGGKSALSFQDLQDISSGNIEAKLILKPLSTITDEDALDVSTIAGGASHLSKESQIHQAKELLTDVFLFTKQTNIVGVSWFGISQFLQSEGYDLPNYLLGGKTLQEAGLAIYE